MSGPAKFWSIAILLVAVVLFGIYRLTPNTPPEEATRAASEPGLASMIPPPTASHPPEVAAGSSETPSTELSPIERKMAAWAESYRANLSPVAEAVDVFEDTPAPPRASCNELLTATYGADSELETAPDPDIDEALRMALNHFAEAGKFCLQENRGLQDTYLLMGRSAVALVEKLLVERYTETGVAGLAEPMDGGTEVGRRAVEFAGQMRRQ
jgi:hypothetical protein